MFSIKKTPINYLTLIPIRIITETTEHEGKITLLVPKFKKTWLLKLLVPHRKSSFYKIHLDDMGSCVWRLIDDKSSVEAICLLLHSKLLYEGKNTEQLEERVTKYLTELYKSKFIRFHK